MKELTNQSPFVSVFVSVPSPVSDCIELYERKPMG